MEDYRCDYVGVVLGIDGCIYRIPRFSNRILKYDSKSGITSYFGREDSDEYFYCWGFSDGVLARDGHIYASTGDQSNAED